MPRKPAVGNVALRAADEHRDGDGNEAEREQNEERRGTGLQHGPHRKPDAGTDQEECQHKQRAAASGGTLLDLVLSCRALERSCAGAARVADWS